MVHPVKTPLGAARAVTQLSMTAVRHPLRTAGDVVTMGRGLVGAVVPGRGADTTASVVESRHPVAEQAPGDESTTLKRQGDPLGRTAGGTVSNPASKPVESEAETDETSTAIPTSSPQQSPEPFVTEPSGVTGPGDDDEIPSPAVPWRDEDIEVTTPVGTTGAGPAINPDTNESDLQQPGTEPLMDPATTKRIKRETETLRKASERHKG